MPILKTTQYGSHKDATVLQFGSGDICVASVREDENPHIRCLVLSQDEPKPFENWKPQKLEYETTKERREIVVLRFDNIHSINAVLNQLKIVRQEFIEANNLTVTEED